MKPLERDLEARRAAQTVFTRPLVLEAGAGTGKTTTLVARILSWVLGAGWHEAAQEAEAAGQELENERLAARVLEGVVAITFTEAAAAEMALRVGQRLSELARSGETRGPGFDPALLLPAPLAREELQVRARALLGSLERATLATIHAFCHLLLRRHSLSLGLHPDFRIDAREDLSEEVAREVVERATRHAYAGRGTHPILQLAARGIGSQRLVEAAARFTVEGTPAATFAETSFSPARIEAVGGELGGAIEALQAAAGDRLRQVSGTDRPARIHAALEATREELAIDREEAIPGLVARITRLDEIWESQLLERLGKWRKSRFTKGEQSAFGDAAAAITAAAGSVLQLVGHLTSLDPELVEEARRALHPIQVEIESQLRARGIATFQSLLVETERLLTDPAVRHRERRRIRQLLVDEFQDTDETQCAIVAGIALRGAEADRPGLFVVGDPKQSIYAWRNADLAAYERFVGQALEERGVRHRLARNFRSAPEILAEVERSISPVMVEKPGLQPPFEPLLAGPSEVLPPAYSNPTSSAVEFWISWDREQLTRGSTNVRQAAEIEARAVAADIDRLHREDGEPWNEFAVLLRTTSRLDDFLEAFRARGVPFAVTGDRHYYRRREVIDAAALLRAIVHPLDHIALVAFLRSPTVGVPDAAWIPLWKQGFPALVTELGGVNEAQLAAIDQAIESAVAETPELPELEAIARGPGWPAALCAAMRALAEMRDAFRCEPVDRFIERLRSRLLLEATEAARYLGVYRVANLERFFRGLEQGLAGGHGDIDALLRALRRSVSEAREDEEALPKEAAADAVQVMTIHKAKGLEFGHVYLPQLHARGRRTEHDVNDADRRPADGDGREYVLFGRPSIGWDRVESQRVESAAAEQVRTLYVAMTRAQKRLVLLGNWARTLKHFSGASVPAPLKLLGHRAPFEPSLAPLAEEIEDPAVGLVDTAGARWKLPDLARERDEPGPETRRPKGESPPLDRVVAWAAELEAAGRAAAERMERPLFAAASSRAAEIEPPTAGGAETRRQPLSRQAALAIGKIVHRALELWDLEAPRDEEWERRRDQVVAEVAGQVGEEGVESAVAWCEDLMIRLRDGEPLSRLCESAPGIVARELPVAVASAGPDEPVVGLTGTVDLLLREADSGDLVIVDYKTDEVTTAEEIAARAEVYAPQLAVYARAVRRALDLDRDPRTELWFLWPGVRRAVTLEAADGP